MIGDRASVRAACLLAIVVLLGACTDDEPGAANTAPPPSPTSSSPSATVQLQPVVGERVSAVFSLGGRALLGLGENPAPDEDAIQAATTAVGDWLDEHLDRLQREGSGTWGAVAAEGLANAKDRAPVTTGLASPDAPVEAARYVMSVYHDGPPRYLTARVEVTHPDESVDMVELVFVTDDEGTPTLTMFAPGPEAEVDG